MIYRLTYCNKDGVEARVDIQKGLATPVIEVEGTERPFVLSYNNDKGDKSGMFLSSSADIEIYETTDFNIDNLKTSNETELSVTHYIDNVISWQGFIIPDFFSIEVRSNPVIKMTASDRLGTLKNVTLSDLPTMVNIRELAVLCLDKTGLSLPLRTMADFSNDDTDNAFFSYYVDSQRIKDIKGRSISCYDILSSILIASNSKLVQRAGEWVIINKLQHETGSGKLYSDTDTFTNYLENIYNFDEVSIGARRTIMPVAGSIGIYHEHGGRKSHPANYDYSLGLSGWNSVNGFTATIENRHITFFLGGAPFFDPDRTVKQYLLNYNNWIDNTTNLNTAPYIATDPIQINSPRADRVEVTVDISSTMAEKLPSNTAISFLRYAVILTNGVKTYTLTRAGIFEILDPENISGHSLTLRGGQQHPLVLASPAFSNSGSFKGLFEVGEDDNVNNYSATIRIYGSGNQYVTVNYALIKFSDVSELPKGTMYKTEQGEVFTKAYDIETSIFGDYLLSGLDGYFYRYPNDDTSSIYKDVNTLSSPIWTTPMTPSETSELPLLHHSTRQMRRMFSVAHDLLSAEIEVTHFDPLAIFVACEKRYTVVSAQFDFFKSNLSVELEEVAFQSASVRDFIYSYFGDGESGIKSIGGISGGAGGGGTGGGLTPEQIEILSWWKKDPDNPDTIFTEMNAYSTKELSAYGLGEGSGSGGGGSLVTWGTTTNNFVDLTVEGISKTVALKGHTHSKTEVGLSNVDNVKQIALSEKGAIGGVAELDAQGKVPSTQLPSYVDDVLEYTNLAGFPTTGETGKIYVAKDTNKIYRWSGTGYIVISDTLALGETSSTAYRGDRGKIAYTHSQAAHAPANAQKNSDITKAEIEAKLTGIITSHSHTVTKADVGLGNVLNVASYSKTETDDLLSSLNVGVTSIGLTAPTGFSVSNSPITSNGDIALSFATGYSLPTTAKQGQWDIAYTNTHTHSNKTQLDLITQSNIDVLAKLSIVNGNLQIDGNAYATGELSAYGAGEGGGGGGSLVVWGTESNGTIPLTVEGISKTIALKSGLDLKQDKLIAGSGITITGNTISANIQELSWDNISGKPSTFTPSAHTHAISDVTNLQTTLNNKLETTVFNTHNNDNVRHITGAERTKWDGAFNRGDFRTYGLGNTPAKTLNDLGAVDNDINTLPRGVNAFIYTTSTATNVPGIPSDYPIGLRMSNNVNVGTTLLFGRYGNDKMWFRNDANGVGNFKPWREVWHDGNLTSLSQLTDNIGVATHIANTSNPHNVTKAQIGLGNVDNTSDLLKPISTAAQNALNLKANLANPTFTGTVTAPTFSGALDGNAAFATALQTPRTIWGQSFDGTGNVTGALSGATTITASTSVTTPKVIFSSAGWSMEQVGSELQMKHNNVLKMRFTSTGSIVATEEITAFG